MSDHADVIRDTLSWIHTHPDLSMEFQRDAEKHLDALVADAAMKERALTDYFADASRRAEAAEAARNEAQDVLGVSVTEEVRLKAEVARLRHAAESYIETIRNPLNGPPARQEAIDALAAALAAPTKEKKA